MSRLFTFGCSFTEYFWPTWADILGKEFDYFENWGKAGGGNQFIFNSLIESSIRNSFNEQDTIIIMWTNVAREDRYINNKWVTPGSIYNQQVYSEEFVKKFADDKGYLIRDLATIHATKQLLEKWKTNYIFLSMVPINNIDLCKFGTLNQEEFLLYKEVVEIIRPSIYETIFNFDWHSKPGFINIEEVITIYNDLKGDSWPSFDKFWSKDFSNCSKRVQEELENLAKKVLVRTDIHPTPLEQLEYINKVISEIKINPSTIEWVHAIDKKLLSSNNYPKWWRTKAPHKRL